ncbi:gas vesicle structural protein 1 [Frankia canadensis]|uniref:Gas vesicle protein A n=1 Tax=Frankia canadensis TaxID=1836972 RepID=A0A2I2KN91_9ACTN|nr:gas vesicle structural protein GvpA [Frankia canadensis]SNQ47135.1 gas vesicle structural protein 1 [Frankia canadensis]SOU54425.1 gas vesicle structural protein 1 [Frankia canadensis]
MSVVSHPVGRAPQPSGLADVLDVVLDKGIVIDAYVRVALVGIEILTIDARIVIASVDTYLRFAEAVNRLDLRPQEQVAGLPGLMHEVTDGTARHKAKGATQGALGGLKDAGGDVVGALRDSLSGASGSVDDQETEPARRRAQDERRVPSERRSGREA